MLLKLFKVKQLKNAAVSTDDSKILFEMSCDCTACLFRDSLQNNLYCWERQKMSETLLTLHVLSPQMSSLYFEKRSSQLTDSQSGLKIHR